jgi:hypothetical protein
MGVKSLVRGCEGYLVAVGSGGVREGFEGWSAWFGRGRNPDGVEKVDGVFATVLLGGGQRGVPWRRVRFGGGLRLRAG